MSLLNMYGALLEEHGNGTTATATTGVIPTTVPTTTAGMFDSTIHNSKIYYYY